MTTAAGRRADRRPRVARTAAPEAALDVLALLDLAWHGRRGDPCPPAEVVDDLLERAGGDVGLLASAALRAAEGGPAAPGPSGSAGHGTSAVADVLALLDLAWRDCYGESTAPTAVRDAVEELAGGDVRRLAPAALLAVTDVRDLWVAVGRVPSPVHSRPVRGRRGGRTRFALSLVGLLAVVGAVIAVQVLLLVHRRDTGSRDRAWDAVGAYAPAAARAAAGGSDLDPTRQAALFEATVPVRTVRERYFRGDLHVAWTVVDRATGAVGACVEMRSLSGDDAYGAAWLATDAPAVRRSAAGSGCGPQPATHPEARRAAAG